jgi:histone deacetylase 1/2
MPLPIGKQVVGYRWIFKTKFNSNGTIELHKAWFVAQGFSQKFEVE